MCLSVCISVLCKGPEARKSMALLEPCEWLNVVGSSELWRREAEGGRTESSPGGAGHKPVNLDPIYGQRHW